MATRIQVTFDCADPVQQARFWASALHYQLEDPPAGHDTWATYWRSIGVPDDEIDEEPGSAVDPDGVGPRIWFQQVPEPKTSKNRLHLDLGVSGGRSVPIEVRRERVEAEAERIVAAGATRLRTLNEYANHYAAVMQDPEGNEFCLH